MHAVSQRKPLKTFETEIFGEWSALENVILFVFCFFVCLFVFNLAHL